MSWLERRPAVRRRRRRTWLGLAANDGDQLCRNTDVFSNVYTSGGRAWVNVCQLNDCPTYVSNCTVQVRWLTKCEWWWCTTFDDRSGWVQINGAGAVSWCQPGKHQYKLEMRTTWSAATTKTVGFFGANEALIEIGGGLVYRLIAHAMFNDLSARPVAPGWCGGELRLQ